MNSDAGNESESESSLPTQQVQVFRSSPPILKSSRSSPSFMPTVLSHENMESGPPMTPNEEGAKSSLKRIRSDETERPPSAQQLRDDADEHVEESDEEEADEMDSDPAEKVVDFDWGALHQRYHDAMSTCQGEEGNLVEEFESLMAYFRIWAESGHNHETDRTFQRLRTRTTYVQNSEKRLEKTRNHYINVVKAFESALNLLRVHGFGG